MLHERLEQCVRFVDTQALSYLITPLARGLYIFDKLRGYLHVWVEWSVEALPCEHRVSNFKATWQRCPPLILPVLPGCELRESYMAPNETNLGGYLHVWEEWSIKEQNALRAYIFAATWQPCPTLILSGYEIYRDSWGNFSPYLHGRDGLDLLHFRITLATLPTPNTASVARARFTGVPGAPFWAC